MPDTHSIPSPTTPIVIKCLQTSPNIPWSRSTELRQEENRHLHTRACHPRASDPPGNKGTAQTQHRQTAPAQRPTGSICTCAGHTDSLATLPLPEHQESGRKCTNVAVFQEMFIMNIEICISYSFCISQNIFPFSTL